MPYVQKLPAAGPTVVSAHSGAVRDAADWLAGQLPAGPAAWRRRGPTRPRRRLSTSRVGELGALILLNRKVREAGGRLTLVDVRPLVAAVFEVTRLDTILDVRRAARVGARTTNASRAGQTARLPARSLRGCPSAVPATGFAAVNPTSGRRLRPVPGDHDLARTRPARRFFRQSSSTRAATTFSAVTAHGTGTAR